MSYARMGDDSGVYVFLCVSGFLECCGCRLGGRGGTFRCTTTTDMIRHLCDHIDAGHKVPTQTIDRLNAERQDNDSWMAEEANV